MYPASLLSPLKYRARICRPFKETRYQFSVWRAGTKSYSAYWPARLHRLAKSIPRNRFLGSKNVFKYGLSWYRKVNILGPNSWKQWSLHTVVFSSCFRKEISRVIDWLREMKNAHQWEFEENSWQWNNIGGFIKDEYCSWVQYKSGPGGGPSM